ncbi:MAG TPA: urease accessory protein UreD [Paracoccaceae bacterium]|nr:urease accessory protein UreD [Paracoccaceae bacterium]
MSALPRQPRAEGTASIRARAGPGGTRLIALHQAGCARILLPEPRRPELEAVLVNTAGGLTGGDRLAWEAEAGPGARLVLASQAAERAYRAQPGETARLDIRLTLGARARIDWLAQDTILFDRSSLRRSLTVDMAADATLLAVEPVILGRAAMGETVEMASFRDCWRVTRGGRLVFADALRLEGRVAEIAAAAPILAGARAFASLLYIAPDAPDRLDEARAALGSQGGASARDGLLLMRLVAPDGLALRRRIIETLARLLGRPLPRVWQL